MEMTEHEIMTTTRVYVGFIDYQMEWQVRVIDAAEETPRPLDPGYAHGVNHSPDGFAWGYGGSGPAQLAFAILCDHLGPVQAKQMYQQFKAAVIARLDQDKGFRLHFNRPDFTMDRDGDGPVISINISVSVSQ